MQPESESESKLKVCVIADSIDPEKGRTCFWPFLQDKLKDINIEINSFVDCRNEKRFLDFRNYDCIVFSWDVLNNDYWMHGEVTHAMTARAAREFLPKWVEEGGLIILEAQTCHWQPFQEAYDCILPKILSKSGLKVRKYGYNRATGCSSYSVVKRHSGHPFLKGLRLNVDYTCDGNNWNKDWFPKWYEMHAKIKDAPKQRTHSGTFLEHKPEWLPLLICSAERQPVMLATVHGKGAIVATTMHLSSSSQVPLIKNLISNWKKGEEQTAFMSEVRDYHDKVLSREKVRYYAPRFFLSFLPAVGCYLGINYFGVYVEPVGVSVVGALLTWKYYDDLARVIIEKSRRLSQWISSYLGGG